MMKIKADSACGALGMGVAATLGLDYVGVRLGGGASPGGVMRRRCVGNMPDLVVGKAAMSGQGGVGGNERLVGIFADDTVQTVLTGVYNFKLDYVQLDGNEGGTFVRNLLRTIVPDVRKRLGVIKGVTIDGAADFGKCLDYEGAVDMFVFRVPESVAAGASAQQMCRLFAAYKGSVPFLLCTEGVAPGVAAAVVRGVAACCGVDVGMSLADDSGRIDEPMLRSYVDACGTAD